MNDKIKINLQMAGSTYPLTILREEEEMVREAAKQVDIRLNAYREHYQNVTPENYSHGGLSICFGEPENEKPKRYSSVCRQDRRTDRGVGNILQRTVNVWKLFLRTPEPAKELENPRTV